MKAVLTNRSVKVYCAACPVTERSPQRCAGLVARVLGHGLTQLFPLYAPPATSRPASSCVRIWLIGRPSKTAVASTTEAKGWERASVLLAFLLAIASGIAQYSMLQSEVKNVKELYSKLDSKLDSSLDKLDSKLDMVFGLDKRVS